MLSLAQEEAHEVDDSEKLSILEQVSKLRTAPSGSKPGKFAFCCSACMDLSVNAAEFVAQVLEHFGLTGRDLRPQIHPVLNTVEQFVESFLFFFERGANAEQRLMRPEVFAQLAKLARKQASLKSYAGGNALTMAQRAALEGGHVVLGGQVSSEAKKQLLPSVEYVIPKEADEIDEHLTLEYQSGDTVKGIANVTSARMNRYYLNSDTHNAHLTAAKSLYANVAQRADAAEYVVSIAGLQLLDRDRLATDVGKRLDEILHAIQSHKGVSHFESGAFEDGLIFDSVWSRGILHAVASIGLNEQELAMLDWKLHRPEDPRPHGSEAKPALEDTLQKLQKVLKTLNHRGHLSRIHFHTLHFHAICYDPLLWERGEAGVAAGSAVTADLSCGDAFQKRDMSRFALRYPRPVKCEKVNESPTQDFECCVAPVLVCKKPVRTAGLGDNISGAGLRYQQPLRPGKQEL